MDRYLETVLTLEAQTGCFGNFNARNPICAQYCALRLRCAIEKEQNLQIEMMEDLMESQDLHTKIQ